MHQKHSVFSYYYWLLPLLSLFLLAGAIYISVRSFLSDPDNESSNMCPQAPAKSTASTRDDAVFLFANAITAGLKLTIKSLRSTGCQARIILITDTEFGPTMEDAEFFKLKEVEIYRKAILPENKTEIVPHMIRYSYEREWLLNHSSVKRVLHSDAYDVFFQKDPFEESVPSDKIVFVVEPHAIRSCGWNLKWFQSCFGDEGVANYRNEFIICSGSIAGGAAEYAKLLDALLQMKEWDTCYGESMDQPILNYLVWSGKLKEKGIKYKFTGCDGGFMTVQWCVINKMVNINDKGQILSPAGFVPAYLHQYNRIDKLEKYLFKSCQMKRPKKAA